MSARLTDETIITALMMQGSIRKAAEYLGCKERTIYERMKKQPFKDLYAEARLEAVRTAAAKLQRYSNDAINVTLTVMADKKAAAQTRLNAAQMILTYSLKLTEQADLAERITALEKELKINE